MTKFNLVIKNAKGEVVWTEPFDDRKLLDRWLAKAKTEPAWKKDYVVEVEDNTAAVEKFEADRKERIEKENAENDLRLADLKKLRTTPPKTVKEVADALALILDHLGIKPDTPRVK